MNTTFENAKVGDRVWSVEYGWGTIEAIGKGAYPVVVSFDCGISIAHTFSGNDGSVKLQTLFWDEIKIEAPPRPKRKVVKKQKLWAVINCHGVIVSVFTKQENALTYAQSWRLDCIEIPVTYEVEE